MSDEYLQNTKKINSAWKVFSLLRNEEEKLIAEPTKFKPNNYKIFQNPKYIKHVENIERVKKPIYEIKKEEVKITIKNNNIPFEFSNEYYKKIKNVPMSFKIPANKENSSQKTFMVSLRNDSYLELSTSVIFTNIEQNILLFFNKKEEYYEPKTIVSVKLNERKINTNTIKDKEIFDKKINKNKIDMIYNLTDLIKKKFSIFIMIKR